MNEEEILKTLRETGFNFDFNKNGKIVCFYSENEVMKDIFERQRIKKKRKALEVSEGKLKVFETKSKPTPGGIVPVVNLSPSIEIKISKINKERLVEILKTSALKELDNQISIVSLKVEKLKLSVKTAKKQICTDKKCINVYNFKLRKLRKLREEYEKDGYCQQKVAL
jgi:hypothetical protein